MAIRINPLVAAPVGLLLTLTAWAQASRSTAAPPDSSAPPVSSAPVRKPRLNQNQEIDEKNGAVTPSTPGTSRTPGTPGAIGTPDHP